MIPRISLVGYEAREPHFIFVAIPDERNRYLKTDRSVAVAACSLCKVPIGVPCLGAFKNYQGSTHVARRVAARSQGPRRPDDVLEDESKVPPEEFWL